MLLLLNGFEIISSRKLLCLLLDLKHPHGPEKRWILKVGEKVDHVVCLSGVNQL